MSEQTEAVEASAEPRVLADTHKLKRRQVIKPTEAIIILCVVVVVGLIINIAVNKITFKRDTEHAQVISDKAINDIQHRDGTAAWKIGTSTFRKTYTPASLTTQFDTIQVATLMPPHLTQEDVVDAPSGRTIFFIYTYTALKVPYYVRTAISMKSGQWQLAAISGSANESNLLVN